MATTKKFKDFRRTSKKYLMAMAIASAIGGMFTSQARAGIAYYWDGNGTSWNTPADWSTTSGSITASAVVPTSADTVTFNTTILNTNQTLTLDGAQSVLGMTFNSTGTVTINQGSSGTLTLGTSGILLNSGAGVATINAPITLGGAQTWTNSSANLFTVAGNISTGSNVLTVAGTDNSAISGAFSSGSGGLTTSGTGTLTLSGTGSSLSTITLTSGTLAVSGGSLTVSSTFRVAGFNGTDNATFNQTGGTVTLNDTGLAFFGNVNGSSATANFSAGKLTKASGTTYLANGGTATMTLSGTASVSLQTLDFGSSNGNATLNLNGGTLAVTQITRDGAGTDTLNFNGGTLKANATNASFMNSGILTSATVKDNGGTIDNGGFNITIGQVLSHGGVASTDGGLTFQGSGTTTLGGANTYTGDTVVAVGTLLLTNSLALQDSPLNYNNQGGTFSFGSLASATVGGLKGAENLPIGSVTSLTFNNQAGTSASYSGQIVGASLNLIESGTGTQTLSGSGSSISTFSLNTGTLVVSGGSLTISSTFRDAGNSSTTAIFNQTGGTVTLNDAGLFFIGNVGGSNATASFTGGTLTKASGFTYLANNGTATMTLGGTASVSLQGLDFGSSTGTATLNLNGGTLAVTQITRDGAGTDTINFNGGTLKANATNASFMNSGILTSANVKDNGGTIDNGGFNITIGQVLSHGGVASIDGGLTFQGAGTTTLSGANTYTGNTIIHAGKVVLTSTGSINNSAVIDIGDTGSSGTVLDVSAHASGFTIGSGQTLQGIGALVTGTGAAKTTNNGILAPGNSIGTLNVTGDYVFGSTSTYQVQTNATTSDKIAITGAATIVSGAAITFDTSAGIGAGNYVLATAASGLNSGTFTGAASSGYALKYSASELDLQHLADQSITGPVNIGRLIAGQSLAGVSLGTLNNTAPSGGAALAVSLSATDSGSPAGTFSSLAAASGSTLAAATSTNLTGNFTTTGSTALGTRNFTISNTDSNAVPTTASLTTGSVDVVTSRVITAGSVNFGRVILGSTGSAQSSALNTTGAFDTTANLTVNNGASGSSSGITASSGSAQLFNSAGSTGTLTVTNGTAFGSTGTQTGTVTLAAGTGNFTGELTGQTLGPIAVAYTIDPVNERTYASPGTVTLGNFLLNANEVVSSNQTITTTGLHDVTADATLGSSTSGTLDGLSLSGGPDFVNGSTTPANLTRTISGTLATNSYGTASGTFNMNSVDEFANTITNAASVSYTANVGLATAALSDRGGTNSADRLAYQMTSTETGSQTLFNGTVLTAVVGNTDSYAGLASKTIAGGTVLGTVATILAGTNQSGGTNTVAMTWRDRSTLERPGGSIPPLPATVGSPRYLISDVVLLTGMNSGAGSTLDTNHTIAGNPYTITNHQTDDFVLQMSYSGGANPTLDWLDPSDSTWKLANAGDFGGNDASGGELDFIGSFSKFQTTYGSTLSAYLGAYGYDPTTSVAWAVIDHNSQFAVVGEVPEPTSVGLLGLGALGLLSRKRRKSRK